VDRADESAFSLRVVHRRDNDRAVTIRRPPHVSTRSSAAVILSRRDPRPCAPTASPPAESSATRSRQWAVVLIWVVLGGAVAALWGLLLLGDSLSVSG
jgi:type VI protein secretion system component VasF